MKSPASLALALLAATAFAQTSSNPSTQTSSTPAAPFSDPANLRGERPRAHDGRELPIDQGASGLQQLLRKLNTRASILNIVAHPDDEDGGMLTFYSRGLGARVADLSLTRGEGGQNAATGDFEDALGLLRTQELLANDRYVGVDQFFGTEVDFGFSKTKEEAFAKWTHQRVLYDVVRAIRIYRPLVLTSTWIGGVTDGHGQHQVSGEITQEAFVAAGDPKVFPELTAEGILPWQPLRIYARVPMQSISPKGLFDYATGQYTPARFTNYVTGEVSTTPPSTDVIVHEGTPDPLLTLASANPSDVPQTSSYTGPFSYIQFARIGLGQQKSQVDRNFHPASPGPFDVNYHLYGSKTLIPPRTSRHDEVRQGSRSEQVSDATEHEQVPQGSRSEQVSDTAQHGQVPQGSRSEQISDAAQHGQVPQGFSLGSHSPFKTVGFSPQGMPSSPDHDPNFFTGIDTSLPGIATLAPSATFPLRDHLEKISTLIHDATENLNPQDIAATAPTLAEALNQMDGLLSLAESSTFDAAQKNNLLQELRIKRSQLNDALAISLGLTFDATSTGDNQVAGQPASVWSRISSQSPATLAVKKVWLSTARGEVVPKAAGREETPNLTSEHSSQITLSASPADTGSITEPYFFRDNIETPVYQLRRPELRNAAQTPPALVAHATLLYKGVPIELSRVVHSGSQPVSFVPLASIATVSHAQVLPTSSTSILVALTVNPPATRVESMLPPHWKVIPDVQPKDSPTGFKQLRLEPSTGKRDPFTFTAIAVMPDKQQITQGYRPVGYGDLPRTNFYTPATTRIVPVDLNLPTRKSIAYLPGTGDAVPEALASIGLAPTILSVADLTPSNLSKFDTVILGVRTYAAHPDLHGAPTQALLDYARNGGNVVVQYQTYEFTAADAPYPLALGSNEKVVDETAPVVLQSGSAGGERLLASPNTITPADFNGWTEERGHGFLSTWDAHYAAPTETHDPGQAPQHGGLLTAQVGKGRWTYVAFALYRQLPEAVPGAFRLFMNLIHP